MQSYIFFRNQTTFATILPQISISGGALVSSAPTKQTVVLPQIAQIYTEAANFRGCTCLKCTNRARTDCLLVKFNNGFIGLNGFDGCVKLTTD